MIKMLLQLFGGRGQIGTAIPGGGGGSDDPEWSSLGFLNHKSLGEALGKKGRPMGMNRAAIGANPKYSPDWHEYRENCQRAVVAYEARRRGYNVTAQATYKGDELPKGVFRNPKTGAVNGRWMGAFQNAKAEHLGSTSARGALKNLNNKMKSYGEGARAIIAFQWSGRGAGGHVVNVEYHGGRIHIRDAQIGKRMDAKVLMNAIRTDSLDIVRTDNLRFSERAKKSVTSQNH